MSSPSDTRPSLPALAPFVVESEIDMASAPALEAALRTHIEASSGDVGVDCAQMTFIDSSGIAVFIRLAHELDAADRRLESPTCRRTVAGSSS